MPKRLTQHNPNIEVMDEMGGPGGEQDYAGYYRHLELVTLLQSETPGGFIQSAPLKTDDEKELVRRWIEIGRIQLHAACTNRYGELRDTRLELQHVLEEMGYENAMEENEPEEWSEHAIMTPIAIDPEILDALNEKAYPKPDEDDEEPIPDPSSEHALELVSTIETLQTKVRAAKARGYFKDHTRLKERYASGESYNMGAKAMELPSFYQKTIDYCDAKRANTRDDHTEALLARMMQKLGLKQQEEQRALQPFSRRSSRNGNSRSDEDDD